MRTQFLSLFFCCCSMRERANQRSTQGCARQNISSQRCGAKAAPAKVSAEGAGLPRLPHQHHSRHRHAVEGEHARPTERGLLLVPQGERERSGDVRPLRKEDRGHRYAQLLRALPRQGAAAVREEPPCGCGAVHRVAGQHAGRDRRRRASGQQWLPPVPWQRGEVSRATESSITTPGRIAASGAQS